MHFAGVVPRPGQDSGLFGDSPVHQLALAQLVSERNVFWKPEKLCPSSPLALAGMKNFVTLRSPVSPDKPSQIAQSLQG